MCTIGSVMGRKAQVNFRVSSQQQLSTVQVRMVYEVCRRLPSYEVHEYYNSVIYFEVTN